MRARAVTREGFAHIVTLENEGQIAVWREVYSHLVGPSLGRREGHQYKSSLNSMSSLS